MHYTVAVIYDDETSSVDEMLAPFDENLEVDAHIYKTKDELIEYSKKALQDLKEAMSEYDKNPDENKKPYWLDDDTNKLSEYYATLFACVTDQDYYDWYRKNNDNDLYDEEGNELSTYNPDSKWDWYVVGGRWEGGLTTKDGITCNEGIVKDMNFEADEKHLERCKRFWEVYVEGDAPKTKDEEDIKENTFYNKEYYLDKYKTKEAYIDSKRHEVAYAILTPDGVWHEPGKMGWFSSLGTYEDEVDFETNAYDRYVKPYEDYNIALVDCHI